MRNAKEIARHLEELLYGEDGRGGVIDERSPLGIVVQDIIDLAAITDGEGEQEEEADDANEDWRDRHHSTPAEERIKAAADFVKPYHCAGDDRRDWILDMVMRIILAESYDSWIETAWKQGREP